MIYKFGDTLLDLSSVNAIQWPGGTTSITVILGSSTLCLTSFIEEKDSPDLSYENICGLRHKELVSAWKACIEDK